MHTKIIASIMILLAGTMLCAQTKIAHLDIQKVFDSLPEVQVAKDSLAQQQSKLEERGTAMLDEYNVLFDSYQKRRANMSDNDRKKLENDLDVKQQQILAFRESGQSMLEQKSKAMLKPVRDKVDEAIGDVARENGYDYILDETEDTVRYANPALDVTDLVLSKLGVTLKK
jgi:outer membrane protein